MHRSIHFLLLNALLAAHPATLSFPSMSGGNYVRSASPNSSKKVIHPPPAKKKKAKTTAAVSVRSVVMNYQSNCTNITILTYCFFTKAFAHAAVRLQALMLEVAAR